MEPKIKHLFYCPFTGLGLHNGFRGNKWLKNRIQIFKQFVLPSLISQTNQDFILWISWRREEKNNTIVKEFIDYLNNIESIHSSREARRKQIGMEVSGRSFSIVHTFSGVCFYDDKYPDEMARDRLITSLHGSMGELLNVIGECDYVLMTIQPSDDLYHRTAVEGIQKLFVAHPEFQAVGFKKGYICNYMTKEVAEYNPLTNPPFYTIKFPREIFIDPLKHAQYTALKQDSGKYKIGTPCPSHEYVGLCFKYASVGDLRGFLVGTHGVNISTTFSNPYKGLPVEKEVLKDFGIYDVTVLKIRMSFFKIFLLKLPFRVQRKLRYIINEWKVFKLSTWPGLIK